MENTIDNFPELFAPPTFIDGRPTMQPGQHCPEFWRSFRDAFASAVYRHDESAEWSPKLFERYEHTECGRPGAEATPANRQAEWRWDALLGAYHNGLCDSRNELADLVLAADQASDFKARYTRFNKVANPRPFGLLYENRLFMAVPKSGNDDDGMRLLVMPSDSIAILEAEPERRDPAGDDESGDGGQSEGSPETPAPTPFGELAVEKMARDLAGIVGESEVRSRLFLCGPYTRLFWHPHPPALPPEAANIARLVDDFEVARTLGDRGESEPQLNALGGALKAAGFQAVIRGGKIYISNHLTEESGDPGDEYGAEIFRSDFVLDLDRIQAEDVRAKEEADARPIESAYERLPSKRGGRTEDAEGEDPAEGDEPEGERSPIDRPSRYMATNLGYEVSLSHRSSMTLAAFVAEEMEGGGPKEDLALWRDDRLVAFIKVGPDGRAKATVIE